MEGKQMYTCPHCNQLIEYGENPCHNCGQEIGWDNSVSNTQADQNLTSEEVKNTTKKEGKPWKKIIALFIFCYIIYSCFLAGNGTPKEYFEEYDTGSVSISSTRIMNYLDDLDGDKIERNKAGYEFAKLIMDKVVSGQRNILDYKEMQFNLDKYPELAPVNAIGNLALRYDFGIEKRAEIKTNIQAPTNLKDEIIKKRNFTQIVSAYVPGKLNGSDDFIGAQYEYFFGEPVPNPSAQPICTFVNNPNNYFNRMGVYYVDGIILDETMKINTVNGFNYEVPRVFVVDDSTRGMFKYYDDLLFEYPDPYTDSGYDDTMKKVQNIFNILYTQYANKDLDPLTYSGKNMDSNVKQMLVSPKNSFVASGEPNVRYDDGLVEVQTHFGLREDPYWVHIRPNATDVIFTGNIRIGSERSVVESFLTNEGYYFEKSDYTVTVYSPNSDMWNFIFNGEGKLREVRINREYTHY